MELLFTPNVALTDTHCDHAKAFTVHFKMKTLLQVMSLGVNNTANLCGRVSGIPIQVATAHLPPNMTLEPMDRVIVEYSGVTSGKLLHAEVVEKTGENDCVDLELSIASKMGFNSKPRPVKITSS